MTDSSITAAGDLTLSAKSQAIIRSTVVAGSVALAAGVAGVAGSGAGVGSENKIGFDVRAYLDGDSASTITATNIGVTADDTSTIEATAGGISIAVSFAPTGGGALSVGVVLAENTITSQVEASIKNMSYIAATTGDVTVTASESAEIDVEAAAASAAAALTPIGVAISGGTTSAKNLLAGTVTASIQSSADVKAYGDVQVSATDTASITAEIKTLSVAGGLISVAVGVSLSENTITENVSASIEDSTVTAASGDILVSADSAATVHTTNTVGAVALGLGGAGQSGKSKTTIEDVTLAFLDASTFEAANGSVTVRADASSNAAPSIFGFSASLVNVADMEADAKIAGSTRAYVSGATGVTASAEYKGHGPERGKAVDELGLRWGDRRQRRQLQARHHAPDDGRDSRGRHPDTWSGLAEPGGHVDELGASALSSTTVSALTVGVTNIETNVDGKTRATIAKDATVKTSGGVVMVSADSINRADSRRRASASASC